MTLRVMCELGQGSEEELRRLVDRARKGEDVEVDALRRVLASNATLWDRALDLAAFAERTLLALVAGDDPTLMEGLERRLAELREELTGPAPTPLTHLLVDRVATCWLLCLYADLRAQVRWPPMSSGPTWSGPRHTHLAMSLVTWTTNRKPVQ